MTDDDTLKTPSTLEDLQLFCLEAMRLATETAIAQRQRDAVYEARFDGLVDRITLLENPPRKT